MEAWTLEVYEVVELEFDEVITLEQIMDQSTLDCIILAVTYLIFHVLITEGVLK